MSIFFSEGISASGVREESLNAAMGNISPLKNVAVATKYGMLGTASSPIHMVTAETGQFKEQLWRTFRTIALAFLLISGVGALIEDRGISKGLVLL
jgi:ATP-dependent metalloprotease